MKICSLRLLLIDPVPILRAGYISILSKIFELTEITELSRLEDVETMRHNCHYDLIVSEISETSGVEPLRRILEKRKRTKFIVSTMAPPTEYVQRSLRVGAKAFVHKSESADVLAAAARAVIAERTFVSDGIAAQLASQIIHVGVETLSDRELSVYTLVGRGHTTKEIAFMLKIGDRTVETYRQRIKQKLGLDNTGEFVRHAIAWAATKPWVCRNDASEAIPCL